MAFLGKFLKNMAIKKVTKKHFIQIMGLIEADIYDYTARKAFFEDLLEGREFDPQLIPIMTIRNSHRALGLEVPEFTPHWREPFTHLLAVLVCSELSYDPTIGSWEDLELITKTFNKQLEKWKHEPTEKKLIRGQMWWQVLKAQKEPEVPIRPLAGEPTRPGAGGKK